MGLLGVPIRDSSQAGNGQRGQGGRLHACPTDPDVYRELAANVQGDPSLRLCSRSVHRLLIVCVLVAAKFLDDHFYNNAYYAKVSQRRLRIGPGYCVLLC